MRTQKLPEKILPFRQSSPASSNGCGELRSVCKHGGGEISVPRVGQEDHDGLPAVLLQSGQLSRRPQGGAGGDAGQHSLGPDKLPPSLEGVLIPYTDNLVVDRTIQGLGNKIGPNALYGREGRLGPRTAGERRQVPPLLP